MRRNISRRRSPTLVSTAAALGAAWSLAGGSAFALELSDIRVESALGQPLRASIGFTLNPNEQMFDFCVRLRQGLGGGPIPAVSRANVSIAGNRIVFTGDVAIKDPLLNMQVVVDCPYTPQLSRQYTLVVDPVEFIENEVIVVDEPAPAATAPAAPVAATTQDVQIPATANVDTPAAGATNARAAIEMNTEYRVQNGDSASAIAARIEGRTNSLRSAISILVASNPEAFPDGDAAKLMAGTLLTIPALEDDSEFGASIAEPTVTNVQEYAPERAQAGPEQIASLTPPAPVADPAVEIAATAAPAEEPVGQAEEIIAPVAGLPQPAVAMTSSPGDEAVATPIEEIAQEETLSGPAGGPVETTTAESATEAEAGPVESELQPGDFVVTPATEAAESAAPVAAAPVVSGADSTASGAGNSWTWLTWPVGGALLLVGGILLLGRQIRQKFSSVAVGDPEKPAPAPETQAEAVADAAEPVSEPDVVPETEQAQQEIAPQPAIEDVDFDLDDSIDNEAISLDADLDAGTGLQDSEEIDVAQDFGFAASGQVEQEIDHEISADASPEPEKSATDSIPPAAQENEPAIPEANVVPEDDYDMSMIVDATKQTIDDTQLTVQDLQAVPVDLDLDSSDSYAINDDTLASEADLETLEQDYQEEFTQTQALNKEIEQAAQELAAKLEADIDDDDPTADEPVLTIEDPGLDPTAEMPARHPEDELTAEMPAHTIESEVTAEMPAQSAATEVTAELAANVDAQNDDLVDDEVTTKLAAAGSEPTVEMQIETVIADLADLDDDE